jgi:hypothetical protein
MDVNGGRGDVWATLGALLVAHAIGGLVIAAVAVPFSLDGTAGGLGVSSHGAARTSVVAFALVSSVVTSLALRPLLATIARLEISQASAFTAIFIGGIVGLAFQMILAAQPSAGPSLSPLAPVLLLAPLAIQLSLVRALAVSRVPSPWRGDGLD